MQIELIYLGLERVLHDLIRNEFIAQGHSLTGAGERSLEARVVKGVRFASLNGFALDYVAILEEGLGPEKITWKMLPGLINYFRLRGVADPKQAATLTIKKWLREGMSTQASKRFSSTGGRHHFIAAAFLNPKIDNYMLSTLDIAIDNEFKKTKDEVI